MLVEADDRRFALTMASDVDRDAMYMEMSDADTGKVAAELYYSDETGRMTLTLYEADFPLWAIEELIKVSKRKLPSAEDLSS